MTSFFSRKELEQLGLKKVGDEVYISRKASIYAAEKISIGNHVRVDDFCILSGDIEIGAHVHISAYSALYAGNAGISIHDYVTISGRCNIYGKTDDYSGKYMTNPMVNESFTNVYDAPVIFERYSLIGCGSTVLPGVKIGEGSAIGCMSLVKKDIEAWGMYVGIPVKRIKDRKKDLLLLEQKQ